jgi:hypothetical protein
LNEASARALVLYLQRAYALIPTTLSEVDAMRPAMASLEAIANGQLAAMLAPVTEDKPAAEVVHPKVLD